MDVHIKYFIPFESRLNFKLVLAEPLDNDKNSHVQNFLNHHGGPGLQHIGLSTSNVAETVQIMTDLGVQFRNPPPTYYKLVRKYFFAKSLDVINLKINFLNVVCMGIRFKYRTHFIIRRDPISKTRTLTKQRF